jgi:carbon-monoxide dehydrogenase medium subunit
LSVREYVEAHSLAEACELAAGYGSEAKLLAGGTALVLLMRQKLLQPEVLVNVSRVPELAGIREMAGGIEIGAAVTHEDAARSALLRARLPALAATFAAVATPRIRHAGTVGGNLAHGDPHLDPPVTLLALDACVVLQSNVGRREVRLGDFFRDYYETALAPGEVLTSVRIPTPRQGDGLAFLKYLPRSQDDYATVDVAVWQRDGETRIALGSVGPTVFRAGAAERLLRDQPRAIDDAAQLAAEAADPEDDVRGSAVYKRELIRVLLPRVLAQARESASIGPC